MGVYISEVRDKRELTFNELVNWYQENPDSLIGKTTQDIIEDIVTVVVIGTYTGEGVGENLTIQKILADSLYIQYYFLYYNMENKMTLKDRAIHKIISCINSSKTQDHMVACKKMISLVYNYNVKNSTMTYLTLIYRNKLAKIREDV